MGENLMCLSHWSVASDRMPHRAPGRVPEHGDENRQPERPADLLRHVNHAGGSTGVLRSHVVQ